MIKEVKKGHNKNHQESSSVKELTSKERNSISAADKSGPHDRRLISPPNVNKNNLKMSLGTLKESISQPHITLNNKALN